MWPFRKPATLLPLPEGPFTPASKDVMFEYSSEGITSRFYYPSNLEQNIRYYQSEWIDWVPDNDYFKGFSAVIMLPWTLIKLGFWLRELLFGGLKIPVVYGAKIEHMPKYKCIVMSHGLGAARFFSSSICANLASFGYLVVAIEHRDGSACNTFYYENEDSVRNNIKSTIKYQNVIFDKNHLEVRHEQVLKRADECRKLIEYLKRINDGKVLPENILDSVEFDYFSLKDLVGRIDIDDLTIGGHSFGAATSLLILHQSDSVRRGILLDPWMFPIKNLNQKLCLLEKPLLIVNSETFHVTSNIKAIEKYTDKRNVEIYTILRTTHEFQTDSVHITGYLLNLFMKKLNAITAVRLNDGLIMRFMKKHMDDHGSIRFDYYDRLMEEQKYFIKPGLTTPWQ